MKADNIIGALRKFLKALNHNSHELAPGERMFLLGYHFLVHITLLLLLQAGEGADFASLCPWLS
jgi:hypothetical protein